MNTITTTVRHLQVGDVLGGSGFVVTHAPYSGTRVAKGRLRLQGHYPNRPVRTVEWGASTTVTVDRPVA